MDLPTLHALQAQWDRHPPTHLLVAVIAQAVGWERPALPDPGAMQAPAQAGDDEDPAALLRAMGFAGGLPAPAAVRDAQTPEEALQAFEQLFFGEVKRGNQL